eukprot:tig00000955_g5794.t1
MATAAGATGLSSSQHLHAPRSSTESRLRREIKALRRQESLIKGRAHANPSVLEQIKSSIEQKEREFMHLLVNGGHGR